MSVSVVHFHQTRSEKWMDSTLTRSVQLCDFFTQALQLKVRRRLIGGASFVVHSYFISLMHSLEGAGSQLGKKENCMIKLYQVPPVWGIPSISPACMKLETWLRIAEIPYQVELPDLATAPKGKIPYIDDDGIRMGDSTLIIERLKVKYDKDLDRDLSDAERAVSLAFRRMLKENFYWVIGHSRYLDEKNWASYREMMMNLLAPNQPPEIQQHVIEGLRATVLGQLKAQGMGRHTSEEAAQIGIEDVKAIADYLGDKPYFMCSKPTLVDATIYAYLGNIMFLPLDSPLKDYGFSRQNLMDYLHRMQERYFPEHSNSKSA